jgi:hypothetical protein
MRIAAPIVLIVALTLLAGCGDSGDGITGSDTVTFDGTKLIQEKWEHTSDCDRPPGASRWGCGWSVSCARPGESVAFIVRR